MKKSRLIPSLFAVCATLSPISLFAAKNSVVEFDPKEAEDLGWRVVDDGVMGGLSKGKMEISKDGILNFSGKLSLENNGGFSSLRTEQVKMDLSDAAGLVARVKGDGRTYQIRLGTEARYRGMEVSFMAEVATKKGEWVEVKVPFEQFAASFRGMKLKDETFNPSQVRRIGLLLGDKKQGSFNLEVDWIRTYGADEKGSDLIKAALSDGRFSILAKALTEAKLVEVLQGKGPFTVFAPTDKAFGKLPKGALENLLKPENREQLQAVLTYHVVSGSISLADALAAKDARTVQGEAVKIGFSDGRVRVNGAAILDADVKCSNGIIHVVDAVLLPKSKKSNAKTTAADDAGLRPLERIEAVIDQGVPVFNKGDHEKCANLYRDCMIALSKDESVGPKIGKALRDLVERSMEIKSATDRAWLLRSGLDHAYSALAGS